jgi:hypothetical protein
MSENPGWIEVRTVIKRLVASPATVIKRLVASMGLGKTLRLTFANHRHQTAGRRRGHTPFLSRLRPTMRHLEEGWFKAFLEKAFRTWIGRLAGSAILALIVWLIAWVASWLLKN